MGCHIIRSRMQPAWGLMLVSVASRGTCVPGRCSRLARWLVAQSMSRCRLYAQVGMEMWARWAHKVLWHDYLPGWALHKSHHEPRLGPFEANDVYAVANAVPAMGLCLYGFVTPTLMGGVCFGAGLGITLFGIMYMFIHDGLVHRRFPVRSATLQHRLGRKAVATPLVAAEFRRAICQFWKDPAC